MPTMLFALTGGTLIAALPSALDTRPPAARANPRRRRPSSAGRRAGRGTPPLRRRADE
ncbi:hypothetical protein [Streptomyces millisiae]|uniref:Uncharacterized protein n=1 Tax=Streptomyces millisiae TaxID=3075542 RepID=A0ABU2LXM8_9ACTN|nr:hypothetical protein [Streptomyces sp. DSM 44918]MDT0322304.1 hypothetical protein [Streptomyces sp. DSM 44918]